MSWRKKRAGFVPGIVHRGLGSKSGRAWMGGESEMREPVERRREARTKDACGKPVAETAVPWTESQIAWWRTDNLSPPIESCSESLF